MWPNGELKLDGKLQQMEIFQDPCTINALSINTIEMDKLPASYTAVGHPCDVKNQFKPEKDEKKVIDDKNVVLYKYLFSSFETVYDIQYNKCDSM